MNSATYNIDQVAELIGRPHSGVRDMVKKKTLPAPMKRTGKTAPMIWRKADIDKFLKITTPAANDPEAPTSLDFLIAQMIETKVAARIEQLRQEMRQEMASAINQAGYSPHDVNRGLIR